MARNNGSYTLTSNIDEFNRQLENQIENALQKASFIIHGQVVKELSGEKSGKEYAVPGTGQVAIQPITVKPKHPRYKVSEFTRNAKKRTGATMYTASAPGEAPASRTGDLRTDYKAKVIGRGYQAEGIVGSTLPYANWLEKGTKRMAPRPHLKVAMKKMKRKVIRSFEGLI